MSAAVHRYAARITWERGDQPFTDKRDSRRHAWHFDGGAVVAGSSSPLSVSHWLSLRSHPSDRSASWRPPVSPSSAC